MRKKRIVHLILLDKFIAPYMNFIQDKFDISNHFFIIHGDLDQFPVSPVPNSLFIRSKKDYIKIIFELICAKKIILHGLFFRNYIIILFLLPRLLSRSLWIIWGGDLYSYRTPKIGPKRQAYELIRAFVIQKVKFILSVPGDFQLAKDWYHTEAQWVPGIAYPDSIVREDMFLLNRSTNEELNILAGNSATDTNHHLELFDILKTYQESSIRIFCPLSYGEMDYRNEVIECGYRLFGKRFVPMTEFMNFNEYCNFLRSIDIGVFNHDRQQGLGNIINLLAMGKTVYLRKNVVHWDFLSNLGVKLNDTKSFALKTNSDEEAKNNAKIICKYFSLENYTNGWESIFEN